ncbi:MAG: hypothetical protein ACLP51_21245 [Syntrophobacteraceae bacterium]
MWAYAWYVAAPSLRRYLPVLPAFALGLLAKTMLVTLPVVLLLLDFWPLGRIPGGPAPAGDLTGADGSRPAPAGGVYRKLILEKPPC